MLYASLRILFTAERHTAAVLLTLFVADLAYSHVHPNAGEGITDYNDWQQDAARDALLPEAANDSVTAILSE